MWQFSSGWEEEPGWFRRGRQDPDLKQQQSQASAPFTLRVESTQPLSQKGILDFELSPIARHSNQKFKRCFLGTQMVLITWCVAVLES